MESEKITKTVYDPEQVVFSIHHNAIPKGITQCAKHAWIKRNDNEIECTKCPTVLIVSADYLKEMTGD